MNRTDPYKVVVWGPGYLGEGCIRLILNRPEFELVGVMAYSEHKNGRDIGELLGMEPVGISVTTNPEDIYKLDADVVLHTGTNMHDDAPRNKEVVRLLESGKNVIAANGYHYPKNRGPELVKLLEDACRKGGTSVHGTGINPGIYLERLVTTLTGLTDKIEHIRCQEYFDMSQCDSERMQRTCTFGMTLEKANSIKDMIHRGANVYYDASLHYCVEKMGHTLDRVETSSEWKVASEDIYLDACGMTIKKGEITCWHLTLDAIVDGKPFMTLEEFFYLEGYEPAEGISGGEHYKVIMEGKPVSLKLNMDLRASILNDQQYVEGSHLTPGYQATAVTMIQNIPKVFSAAPGIVLPEVWTHYANDYRKLA